MNHCDPTASEPARALNWTPRIYYLGRDVFSIFSKLLFGKLIAACGHHEERICPVQGSEAPRPFGLRCYGIPLCILFRPFS